MNEPFRTLFAGLEDAYLFRDYLGGDEPDWAGLLNDERLPGLSTGEKVLLDMAAWFAGPWHMIDGAYRRRIATAFLTVWDGS